MDRATACDRDGLLGKKISIQDRVQTQASGASDLNEYVATLRSVDRHDCRVYSSSKRGGNPDNEDTISVPLTVEDETTC